MNNPLKIHKGY